MTDFAARLNSIIFALKIRKGDFAAAGGVNGATLGGYLNDGRLPNQKTLGNWVKAYNLNAHWLLTGEGEMLADHQNPPLQHPLAQRVNQVALVMSGSGVDDLELLRAVRAMVDGEMDKLTQRRGGTGSSTPPGGASRAEDAGSPTSAQRKVAGDDSV
jgi:hypothetical protein